MRSHDLFRTAVRVVAVGVWSVLLGGTLALVTVRVQSLLGTGAAEEPAVTGLSVGQAVDATLAGAYDAGVVSAGVGATLVLLGGRLFLGAGRA